MSEQKSLGQIHHEACGAFCVKAGYPTIGWANVGNEIKEICEAGAEAVAAHVRAESAERIKILQSECEFHLSAYQALKGAGTARIASTSNCLIISEQHCNDLQNRIAALEAALKEARTSAIEECVALALKVADDYYAQANKRDAAGYLCDVSTGASKAAVAIRTALKAVQS